MRFVLLISLSMIFLVGSSQIVNIPDLNFKNYLLADTSINTNGDAEIQVSEASGYSGQILLDQLGITSLEGIEFFTQITSLSIDDTNHINMDLSNNTEIQYLDFLYLSTDTLDLRNCCGLIHANIHFTECLDVQFCQYAPLDYVFIDDNSIERLIWSQLDSLKYLRFVGEGLQAIQLDSMQNLEWVDVISWSCDSVILNNSESLFKVYLNTNSLQVLNTNGCDSILQFYLSTAYPIELSWTNYDQLRNLDIDITPIDSIPLAMLPSLTWFRSINGMFKRFDVSDKPNFEMLWISNNDSLAELNVANGNNLDWYDYSVWNCSNLFCIQVDNEPWCTSNWTTDAHAQFSEDCSNFHVNINDEKIEEYLIYPNPANDVIHIDLELISESNIHFVNSRGEIILTEKLNDSRSSIDVSSFPRGLYFISIVTESEKITNKLILY